MRENLHIYHNIGIVQSPRHHMAKPVLLLTTTTLVQRRREEEQTRRRRRRRVSSSSSLKSIDSSSSISRTNNNYYNNNNHNKKSQRRRGRRLKATSTSNNNNSINKSMLLFTEEEEESELSRRQRRPIAEEAISWAFQHGLVVASGAKQAGQTFHAPVSLYPTQFPREVFEFAKDITPKFAELYDKVSLDDNFMRETLREAALNDPEFTGKLWKIYETCGKANNGRVNKELGILRTDYMHDTKSGLPLQVEVNTVSTSFMGLGSKCTEMHRHLAKYVGDDKFDLKNMPINESLNQAAKTLCEGWKAMKYENASILMVVQEGETNIFDQRLISQKVFETIGVKTIRKTLREINENGKLDHETNLFSIDGKLCSVVYFRAGYAPNDFPSEVQWDAKMLLEKSSSLKSPSVAMHLAGSKKIQQALAEEGVLEKYMPNDAKDMRKVFAGLYSFEGEENMKKSIALGLSSPSDYVLKPQREGGGNNLYGEKMKEKLENDTKDLAAYILMQRIFPPSHEVTMLRKGLAYEIESLSELGIYSSYLRIGDISDGQNMNEHGGSLLRTKAASSDEGGVAAGYAVLDSPYLV